MKIDHFLIKKVTPKNRPVFEIQKEQIASENRPFLEKKEKRLPVKIN